MRDLFISYSTVESPIAHRIYGDIIKRGGSAYLYEKETDLVDFTKEIKREIENAKYFCFIDSPNARNAKYVRMECQHAIDCKFLEESRFIVIKFAPNDYNSEDPEKNWRKIALEVFEKINITRHLVDLSTDNEEYKSSFDFRFDTGEQYYNICLKRICDILELQNKAFTPDYHDFDTELNALELEKDQAEILKADFQIILDRERKGFLNLERRLKILISDCNHLKIKMIIPYLKLGAFYLKKMDYDAAKKIYLEALNNFNDDPRPHMGIMYAAHYLGNDHLALEASIMAERVAKLHIHIKTVATHLLEIQYNKIKFLYINDKTKEAYTEFMLLHEDIKILPEFQALLLLIYIKERELPKTIESMYRKVRKYYIVDNIFNVSEVELMIELETAMMKYYKKIGNLTKAKTHFEEFNIFNQNDLVETVCNLCTFLGTKFLHEVVRPVYEMYKHFTPKTIDEKYFFGLLLFLEGKTYEASKLYKNTRELNYPDYHFFISNPKVISSLLGI